MSRPEQSGEERGYTTQETVLVLVAGVAIMGGLLHIGAAVDHLVRVTMVRFDSATRISRCRVAG